MAKIIEEIMNRELFSLRPEDDVDDAMGYLIAMGIKGAPVVDARGRPLGVVSMQDLAWSRGGPKVSDRMTSPAVSVMPKTSVRDAARLLAEHGIHRAPVVDAAGQAIGMVSILDLLRAMLGVPVAHPDTFPHYDDATGLVWTDDALLDLDHASVAPDGPGLLVLRIGGANMAEADVWAETANNLRARVHDLVSLPQTDSRLSALLRRFPTDLRFRCARVTDSEERERVLADIRQRIEDWTAPSSRPPSLQPHTAAR